MSSGSHRGEARRVTRDVEPSVLGDLLERPPRATVAYVDGDEIDVLPVRARARADAYGFGVPPTFATDFENREVVLLIDDGAYWFELRGVSVRGPARRVEHAEPAEADALTWYAIEPRRVLAWDYGAIREG
ncbi:MAG TPA: hypothetical protein VHF87_22370 [Methylomirabilota bacterium]|jgi:hypothetical protein|nr:hypothetical protein [Methylomirabilota bacterium]